MSCHAAEPQATPKAPARFRCFQVFLRNQMKIISSISLHFLHLLEGLEPSLAQACTMGAQPTSPTTHGSNQRAQVPCRMHQESDFSGSCWPSGLQPKPADVTGIEGGMKEHVARFDVHFSCRAFFYQPKICKTSMQSISEY